uniref:Uncharacterized protein n=1 Tax=Macrostomum lignano TaxID=282301 RepID=A0A1I8HF92_9PLAT
METFKHAKPAAGFPGRRAHGAGAADYGSSRDRPGGSGPRGAAPAARAKPAGAQPAEAAQPAQHAEVFGEEVQILPHQAGNYYSNRAHFCFSNLLRAGVHHEEDYRSLI